MEKTTDWFKWYPSRWRSNEWVQERTLEEKGYYHELLNWQMERGSIPGDPKKHVSYMLSTQDQTEKLWEVVSSRFEKKTRYWISNSFNPDDGHWQNMTDEELTECHKNGDRYINDVCEQIRASGHRRYQQAVGRGEKSAAVKAATAEIIKAAEAQENPFAKEISKLICRHYPKRKDRVGWEDGIQMAVDSIDTDELFQRFEAAIRSYRQQTAGTESKYIKRLDKFMGEWAGYVPEGFKLRLVVDEPETVKGKQRRQLLEGEKPPWVPDRFDSDEQKARLVANWPPERQERWWNNELEIDFPQKGAN